MNQADTELPQLNQVRLDVLLRSYEIERAGEIQAGSIQLGLLTASIGLLSVVGFAVVHVSDLPAWLVALAPLLPVPFMAFTALFSYLAQVGGLTVDHYERELRHLCDGYEANGLRVPSGHFIGARVWASWFARAVLLLSTLVLVPLYVAVLIESFIHARQSEPLLAWLGLTGASAALALIVILFSVATRPERFFAQQTATLRDEAQAPPTRTPALVALPMLLITRSRRTIYRGRRR